MIDTIVKTTDPHGMIASSPQKPDMRLDGSEEVMLFSFTPWFPTHALVF